MRAAGPSDGATALGECLSAAERPANAAGRLERSAVPRLYAIADGDMLAAGSDQTAVDRVAAAVDAMASAGILWIQLRLKSLSDRDRLEVGEAVLRRLEGSRVSLWIDDRADLAAVLGARGVHVGQRDLSPKSARAVVGDGTWIGLSCHDVDQVAAADSDPDVDVIAIGPVFATQSKANPDPVVGLGGVREARHRTAKPLVAIGGIDAANAAAVLGAGADSAVMLGAVCRGDVAASSRALVRAAAAGFPVAAD